MERFIFISYAQPDRAVANTVCARLEAAGISCWISPRDVHGVDSRDEAIADAAAMVVVFSRAANVSRQVRDDVAGAVDSGATIVPFRIDDAEPTGALQARLASAEWVDGVPPPYEAHLGLLVETLAQRVPVGTPAPIIISAAPVPAAPVSAAPIMTSAVPDMASDFDEHRSSDQDWPDEGSAPEEAPRRRSTALIAAGVIALVLIVLGVGLSVLKQPLVQQASNNTSNTYYPPEQSSTAPASAADQPTKPETQTASAPASAEHPAPAEPPTAAPAPPSPLPSTGSTAPSAPVTDTPPPAHLEMPTAPVRVLTGDTDTVDALAFSPDGRLLLSGSDDHSVRLWDVVSGRETQLSSHAKGRIVAVAYAPHGDLAAWSSTGSGGDGESRPLISLWDLAHRRALSSLTLPAGTRDATAPSALAFSPDQRFIAAGSDDGTIRLWDIAGRRVAQSWSGHKKGVLSLAFSPDGKLLASGGGDGVVRLWDASTGEAVRSLTGHTRWVRSVAFSPDGSQLASGSEDKTIRLWDVATGEAERILKGHARWVRSVAFAPDGHTLVSGGQDNAVKLWNVANGRELRTLNGHNGPVFTVAVSPQGGIVASAGADQTIRLWNLASIEEAGR